MIMVECFAIYSTLRNVGLIGYTESLHIEWNVPARYEIVRMLGGGKYSEVRICQSYRGSPGRNLVIRNRSSRASICQMRKSVS